MIFLTDSDPGVLDYLKITSEMVAKCRFESTVRLVYEGGMSSFLLEHGRFWQPCLKRDDVRWGVAKQCFDNAYKLAIRRGWRYVEGVAYSERSILPLHHAWSIDDLGNLVDNTWRGTTLSYFGVEFSVEYMRDVRKRTKLWPALDNYKNFEIYKRRFEDQALSNVG
jgi:hypothetical protein